MDTKQKPLRLFVNPFAPWAHLAFKTGQAMWASVLPAVVQSSTKVGVIPTADAPAPDRPVAKTAKAKPRPKARAKRRGKR